MKKITLPLLFLVTILISSCKTHINADIEKQQLYFQEEYTNPNAKRKDRILKRRKFEPTVFWAHYNATERAGLYMVYTDTNEVIRIKVISEPPPDAAISSTISSLLEVKATDYVDVTAKFDAIKSVAELGVRNAANYMIRDFAFRIEALKNNQDSIDKDVKELYLKLLETAEKVSIEESKARAESSKVDGLVELRKMYELANDTTQKFRPDSTLLKKMESLILPD